MQDVAGRDIWVNGVNAIFTNNGVTTIKKMLLSSGSFTNAGDFTVATFANYITMNNTATGIILGVDSFYNNGSLSNDGIINVSAFYNDSVMNNYGTIKGLTTVVDSMFNNGTFLNDTGALLQADSCINNITFTNNGVANFNQFTNTGTFTNNNNLTFGDFTNTATFINIDSLIGTGSMTNIGAFDNKNGAVFDLGLSFLNADVINFDANFNNDGVFTIGDSFFNFDTITGGTTGSFTLQDSSINYANGYMVGSFDFCDLTPPATTPFVDVNLGFIDANITYCTTTNIVMETAVSKFSIFPNPTTQLINIETKEKVVVEIYNTMGKQLLVSIAKTIDLSAYPNGIYVVQIKNEEGETLQQSKVVKQK